MVQKCFQRLLSHDDGSSLKSRVLGKSGRSVGVTLDGQNDSNWTVMNQTGRSKRLKVDGPEIQRWMVHREKTQRSAEMNLDGLKG